MSVVNKIAAGILAASSLFGVASSRLLAQTAENLQAQTTVAPAEPTTADLDAIMHRKGSDKPKTLEDARKIFFQEQKQTQERAEREQKEREGQQKISAGLPLLKIIFDTISDKGSANPDPSALEKAIKEFVDGGAIIRRPYINPYASDIHLSRVRDQELSPVAVIGAMGAIPPYDEDMPTRIVQGSGAMVVLLDVLQQAASKMDETNPRYDGVSAIQNALHQELAKTECGASPPSGAVSVKLGQCPLNGAQLIVAAK